MTKKPQSQLLIWPDHEMQQPLYSTMEETNVVPANSRETNVSPTTDTETYDVVSATNTEVNVIPATTETNDFSSVFSYYNTQPPISEGQQLLAGTNQVENEAQSTTRSPWVAGTANLDGSREWMSGPSTFCSAQFQLAPEEEGLTEENPEQDPAYLWWEHPDYIGNKYAEIGNGESYWGGPRVLLGLSNGEIVSPLALAPEFVPSSSTGSNQHEPPKPRSPLYKTKLCRYKSSCSKGDLCDFAHSDDEIRMPPKFPSKCKYGSPCPHGSKCFYSRH